MGERADEQRLRDAGHAFDERVLAGDDGDEAFVHHVGLADDDFRDFSARGGEGGF